MNWHQGDNNVHAAVTFHNTDFISAPANVVLMSDHIARLRDEGKMKRRGFFFTYTPEGASVIDLASRRQARQ